METKIGKINKVEKKTTRADIPFVRVEIDGVWYSCFESKLYDQLIDGQTISFEYEKGKDDRFLNIRDIHTNVSSENSTTSGAFKSPLFPPETYPSLSPHSEMMKKVEDLERQIKQLRKSFNDHLVDEWGHQI